MKATRSGPAFSVPTESTPLFISRAASLLFFGAEIGFLVLMFFCFSCKNPSSPLIPDMTKANIVLDSNIGQRYTYFGCLEFTGIVKNTGTGTAYNIMVLITCYSDISKRIIIDIAKGLPANFGDIEPGQRVFFSAVAYRITSYSQVGAFDYKIIWANR